jgi:hypothetical protein
MRSLFPTWFLVALAIATGSGAIALSGAALGQQLQQQPPLAQTR